jgi:hypothetical protein
MTTMMKQCINTIDQHKTRDANLLENFRVFFRTLLCFSVSLVKGKMILPAHQRNATIFQFIFHLSYMMNYLHFILVFLNQREKKTRMFSTWKTLFLGVENWWNKREMKKQRFLCEKSVNVLVINSSKNKTILVCFLINWNFLRIYKQHIDQTQHFIRRAESKTYKIRVSRKKKKEKWKIKCY